MTHETSATTSTTNGARPENPFAESFNGRLRDECLRIDWFMSLSHASLSNLVSLTLSHKTELPSAPCQQLPRCLVVGSSCRTLGRIFVSKEQMWTRNTTTSYVLIGDNYPPEGESMPLAVTFHSKKSRLSTPCTNTSRNLSSKAGGAL